MGKVRNCRGVPVVGVLLIVIEMVAVWKGQGSALPLHLCCQSILLSSPRDFMQEELIVAS